MSAQQVMRVAQGLYERGYITYMRTDSTTLSETGARRGPSADPRACSGREYLPDAPRVVHEEVEERAGGPRGDPSGGRHVAHAGTVER